MEVEGRLWLFSEGDMAGTVEKGFWIRRGILLARIEDGAERRKQPARRGPAGASASCAGTVRFWQKADRGDEVDGRARIDGLDSRWAVKRRKRPVSRLHTRQLKELSAEMEENEAS